MRARSKETERVYRTVRRPMVARMLEAEPWCQIRWPGVCTGRSECLHEAVKRSACGSITDEENVVVCCGRCNQEVENDPKKAERMGFVIRPVHVPHYNVVEAS